LENVSTRFDGGSLGTKHIGEVSLIDEFQRCKITLRDWDSAYILETFLKFGTLQDCGFH